MEYKEIRQLMEDMEKSKLTSFDIELTDGTKISMKKETVVQVAAPVIEKTGTTQSTQGAKTSSHDEEKEAIQGNIVKSPMVGTFYLKPSPTATPYVEVGKTVKKGDTLCIIEAMKLMNEIESEFAGKIKEILVQDGEAVEYGKPLFVIE